MPETLMADIARCEGLLMAAAQPRCVWKLYPLLPDGTLAGSCFNPRGKAVRELLRDLDVSIPDGIPLLFGDRVLLAPPETPGPVR